MIRFIVCQMPSAHFYRVYVSQNSQKNKSQFFQLSIIMTIDLNELISGLFDELFSPCCCVLFFYKTIVKSTMHSHEPFTYIVSGYPIINREGKSHFFNRNASFQKCQIYFKSFVHGFSKLHFFQNLKLSVRLTYLI